MAPLTPEVRLRWARGRPVRWRTFPLPGLHPLEALVPPPPPPRSRGSSEPQMSYVTRPLGMGAQP